MNGHLPTLREIESLHRKYAPNEAIFEVVYGHCQVVAEIALQLAGSSSLTLDLELVRAGSMLHDIGVYKLHDEHGAEKDQSKYITHGILGETILKTEGLPSSLWRIASHHTGSGISRRDVIDNKLPLPARDYMAASLEEKLVMYADKFHSKSDPPSFNSFDYYVSYAARFGEDSLDRFKRLAAIFGKPKLDQLAARWGQAIRS